VLELPGADPASIAVLVAGRSFTVSGVRERPILPGARYQQMEIEYGPFQRRIPLDEPVDTSAATARYEHGMLTVVLPIAVSQPKLERVTIRIGARG
jgi:HSP20 family protein